MTPPAQRHLRKRIGLALLSIVNAALLYYALPEAAQGSYAISFAPAIVAIAFFALYSARLSSSLDWMRRNHWKGSALTGILALLFSSFIVFGALCTSDIFALSAQDLIVRIIAIASCACPIYIALIAASETLDRYASNARVAAVSDKTSAFKWMAIVLLILVVAWLPYYLAAYPGYFVYDVHAEWTQYSTNQLAPSSPVLHTLILGSLMSLGMSLHDTINFGIAFFTAIQALFVAGTFTYVLHWMRTNGAPRALVYGSLAYLALDPIIPITAMCSTKDILFTSFALLLLCNASSWVRTNVKRSALIASCIALLIIGFFFCNLRYNGLYIFVIWSIVAMVIARNHLKMLLGATCALVIAASLLWLGPIASTIGVESSQDDYRMAMFSIPQQQIAFVVEQGALSSAEEELLLSAGYTMPDPEKYKDDIADSTFKTINGMSRSDALRCYITIGLQHPTEYLIAALRMTKDAWNPYSYIDCYNGYSPFYDEWETSFFYAGTASLGTEDSKLPALATWAKEICLDYSLQSIPFLALLVSLPLYVWFACFFIFRALLTRNERALLMTALIFLCMLSAFVGPCVLVRYNLILFYGLPLMANCILVARSTQLHKSHTLP